MRKLMGVLLISGILGMIYAIATKNSGFFRFEMVMALCALILLLVTPK